MRMLNFARRNALEIMRDPLNLAFGLGFPVVLLALLSAIQANIPVEMFEISHLTPGIAVFGLSFITLFSATIISRDRSSAFLLRLYSTPMTAADFILGYTLPMIPISALQTVACYLAAMVIGLDFSVNIIYAVLINVPVSLFYIGLGLLCGSIFNDKQVGGICGALLTNVSAWLSGTWFDIGLVGGVFEKIANFLPFIHAVDAGRAVMAGNYMEILSDMTWVMAYSVIAIIAAIYAFLRQMNRQ